MVGVGYKADVKIRRHPLDGFTHAIAVEADHHDSFRATAGSSVGEGMRDERDTGHGDEGLHPARGDGRLRPIAARAGEPRAAARCENHGLRDVSTPVHPAHVNTW